MALDLNLFREVVAVEFASMTDIQLNTFGTEAEAEVSEKAFNKRYPRALALMTAHLIVLSKTNSVGAGVGQLKKVKVGALEREYVATDSESADSLELSRYGREYKRLMRQNVRSPIVV